MKASEKFIAYKTIVIREVLRFSRIWVQTIVPPMVTTALYFVIFGNLIGERIGAMEGHQYIDYIIPGLIMMAVITNSYANVVTSFYGTKFQHHIEEMLVSPVPYYIILLGFITGGVARGFSVGIAVTVVAGFFSDLQVHNLFVIFSMILLTSMLFSLAGFINGIFAHSFDDISLIPTFVLTPLTYLGGIFYSIKLLPDFWQNVSLFNPILYMVNAFRYGFLGVSDIELGLSYTITLIFVSVLYLSALYFLKKGYGIKT